MLKVDERAAIEAAMLNFHGTVKRGKTRRAYGATIPPRSHQDAPEFTGYNYLNARYDITVPMPSVAFEQSSRAAREAYYR